MVYSNKFQWPNRLEIPYFHSIFPLWKLEISIAFSQLVQITIRYLSLSRFVTCHCHDSLFVTVTIRYLSLSWFIICQCHDSLFISVTIHSLSMLQFVVCQCHNLLFVNVTIHHLSMLQFVICQCHDSSFLVDWLFANVTIHYLLMLQFVIYWCYNFLFSAFVDSSFTQFTIAFAILPICQLALQNTLNEVALFFGPFPWRF